MKIGPFEFSLSEAAGAAGDFGVLLPLALGYMVACNVEPSGLLVALGLSNIFTGLAYRLPVAVEPMKVIAAVAISQSWSPALVRASGMAMGLVWIFLFITKAMRFVARATPASVITGIQISLGMMLAWQAAKMILPQWPAGLASLALALALRNNRHLPGPIALLALGLGLTVLQGRWPEMQISLTWPRIYPIQPEAIWQSMLQAGLSQIPITIANAVIATAALIESYWPDKRSEGAKLPLSTGIMNLIAPFLGGMPMCHGAGGLAAKYYFGARTGGANIIEGLLEILAGLFLATSIVRILSVFPLAVMGAMLFLVGLELIKFVRDVLPGSEMIPTIAVIAVSLAVNIAYGFVAGLAVYYFLQSKFVKKIF